MTVPEPSAAESFAAGLLMAATCVVACLGLLWLVVVIGLAVAR